MDGFVDSRYVFMNDLFRPRCDVVSGVCDCKENVEGRRCDMCRSGHFHIDSGTSSDAHPASASIIPLIVKWREDILKVSSYSLNKYQV